LNQLEDKAIANEFHKAAGVIEDRTHSLPTLCRSYANIGHGDPCRVAFDEFQYDVILWTIDPKDWSGVSAGEIVERVTTAPHTATGSFDGAIILLHDGSDNVPDARPTVEATAYLIPWFLEKGYTPVTVSAMLEYARK
jgi:peptidoglycan/xylan/chitin deacetylase (PgdA/CDA1 family)